MPKRYTTPESCRGKIAYTSRGEAKTVLRRGRFKHNVTGSLRVYTCNICGQLHIGSTGNPGGKRSQTKRALMGKNPRKRTPSRKRKNLQHDQRREL